MSPEDRNTLLVFARQCVQAALEHKVLPTLNNPSEALSYDKAAFVTLRSHGQLRGCIRQLKATGPLWKCVQEMAESSACRDHRFSPLQPGDPFTLEISILSPSFPISIPQIQVGLHGLIVEMKGKRGVLLPHVATENGWTPLQFLEQTLLKANLPVTSMEDPNLKLEAFTTDLLSEF